MIPSKDSFVLAVIETSPTDTSIGVVELKSKWNFPGLALRWLYVNQWKRLLEISSNSEVIVWVPAAREYVIAKSA